MSNKIDQLIPAAEVEWEKSKDVETVLRIIRENGGNKNDCITIVKLLGIISKGEVKRFVHESDAWKDCAESDEKLHDGLDSIE